MKDVPAPDRVSSDQSDHHLRHRTDQLLQIEDVQSRDTLVVDITGCPPNPLVASRAEGIFSIAVGPGSGQQNHPNLWIFTSIEERLDHLVNRPGTKSIALGRSIDRHLRDAIRLVIEDIFKLSYFPPMNAHVRSRPNRKNQRSTVVSVL